MPPPDPANAAPSDDPALLRIDGPIATITLNRLAPSLDHLSIAKPTARRRDRAATVRVW
jgi:hypothetical protein